MDVAATRTGNIHRNHLGFHRVQRLLLENRSTYCLLSNSYNIFHFVNYNSTVKCLWTDRFQQRRFSTNEPSKHISCGFVKTYIAYKFNFINLLQFIRSSIIFCVVSVVLMIGLWLYTVYQQDGRFTVHTMELSYMCLQDAAICWDNIHIMVIVNMAIQLTHNKLLEYYEN